MRLCEFGRQRSNAFGGNFSRIRMRRVKRCSLCPAREITRIGFARIQRNFLLTHEPGKWAFIEPGRFKRHRHQVHRIRGIVRQHGCGTGCPLIGRAAPEAHIELFHPRLERQRIEITRAFVHVIGHGIRQPFEAIRVCRFATLPGHRNRQDRNGRFRHQPDRHTAWRRELLDLGKIAFMNDDIQASVIPTRLDRRCNRRNFCVGLRRLD